MRVVAMSDQHGFLPEVPPCDLLLVGGDICPIHDHSIDAQRAFLDREVRGWLERVPARHVVATWGNHDFIGQVAPDLVPAGLGWRMFVDEGDVIDGYRVWGTPWQPVFCDWAFMLTEDELEKKWALIPPGTDLLVCHSPPYGYGDNAPRPNAPDELVGSPTLLKRLRQIRPRIVIYGHIHNGRGTYSLPGEPPVTLANVAVCDEAYNLAHPPVVFDLPDR